MENKAEAPQVPRSVLASRSLVLHCRGASRRTDISVRVGFKEELINVLTLIPLPSYQIIIELYYWYSSTFSF